MLTTNNPKEASWTLSHKLLHEKNWRDSGHKNTRLQTISPPIQHCCNDKLVGNERQSGVWERRREEALSLFKSLPTVWQTVLHCWNQLRGNKRPVGLERGSCSTLPRRTTGDLDTWQKGTWREWFQPWEVRLSSSIGHKGPHTESRPGETPELQHAR